MPGCVATGRTRRQVGNRIASAIKFHIEGMRESGKKVPRPSTVSRTVELQPA